MTWQLAEAKNKLSEVVTRALTEGPQKITRRNQTVVVISQNEFDRLSGDCLSFKEFLLSAPDFSGLDLERDMTPMREFEW